MPTDFTVQCARNVYVYWILKNLMEMNSFTFSKFENTSFGQLTATKIQLQGGLPQPPTMGSAADPARGTAPRAPL